MLAVAVGGCCLDIFLSPIIPLTLCLLFSLPVAHSLSLTTETMALYTQR